MTEERAQTGGGDAEKVCLPVDAQESARAQDVKEADGVRLCGVLRAAVRWSRENDPCSRDPEDCSVVRCHDHEGDAPIEPLSCHLERCLVGVEECHLPFS